MDKVGLKNVLQIPSFFLQEGQMIHYIESVLSTIPGVEYHHDAFGNIYAQKGISEFYPLVCAHTDTVHKIEEYNVLEVVSPQGPAFKAYNSDNNAVGIGGDNKTGIFVCLELLKSQEVIKAAFFIGEEFGCYGAALSDPEFFTNVGYALEFDAPDFFWVSYKSCGVRLFDTKGEFWRKANPLMMEHCQGKTDFMNGDHPYTDIYLLKSFYDFSCLNFSSGYMRMHSTEEYVVIEYVHKAITTATRLLKELGNSKYHFVSERLDRARVYQNKVAHPLVLKYPELLEKTKTTQTVVS